jgi:Hydrolases of the alpha/beta superfamily
MSEKTYDVLDRPEVLNVLFYPRRDVSVPRASPTTFTVRVAVAPNLTVGGRIYYAGAGCPVILYFHGNGEIAADYDTIAPFYTRLGLTLFVADYRGYGTSDGAPTATGLLRDAWTCFDQVRGVMGEQGLDAGDVYVMGRSLGSAAALEVASRCSTGLAGLIIESGFAYTFPLIERIGFLQVPDAFEHKDGFGNLDKIAKTGLPTLIIHGERDWIIPVGDGEALYDTSPSARKTFVRIPGGGHNDLMLVGRKQYFEAVAAFCGRAAENADADVIEEPSSVAGDGKAIPGSGSPPPRR